MRKMHCNRESLLGCFQLYCIPPQGGITIHLMPITTTTSCPEKCVKLYYALFFYTSCQEFGQASCISFTFIDIAVSH